MKTVVIEILGDPMGKQRPKARNTGKFIQIYTPKETTNYESKVVYAYRMKYAGMTFNVGEQIGAIITAYYKIPKSCYAYHKKTNTTDLTKEGERMLNGELRPLKKPDTDNLAKICLDALNGIAYPDDSQIVALTVNKYYAQEPKVEVKLYGLNPTREEAH